jgi:hypothetical protein
LLLDKDTGEPFQEHLSPTRNRVLAKVADRHPPINPAPRKRQIGRSTNISAVNSLRDNTARQACTGELLESNPYDNPIRLRRSPLNKNPLRDKAGRPKWLIPRADPS